jgi:hypothetical protein
MHNHLGNSLRDFRNQIHRASTEREIEVDKAKRALAGGGIEQRRVVRADSARLEESVLTARREVDDVRRSTVASKPHFLFVLFLRY